MINKKLYLGLFCCLLLTTIACRDSLKEMNKIGNPEDLKYAALLDAREGMGVKSVMPTVQTGGLIPKFELVSVRKGDGSSLEPSLMQYISIGGTTPVTIPVNPPDDIVDENGNPITSVKTVRSNENGVISISSGHTLPPGDYYFTVRVSTEQGGAQYSSVFEDAFHLRINPLLPNKMIYAPKNQNLVYGDPGSKTSTPILPSGNPDLTYKLDNHTDKLVIDEATGEVSLLSGYVYSSREVLDVALRVVSNISGEEVLFKDILTVVITDTPEEMPIETVYFFYPTLNTSLARPSGGNGYAVQTLLPGLSERIWGQVINTYGRFFVPENRPVENAGQTVLQTETYDSRSGSPTASQGTPFNMWMVTNTQDLTPFRYGYRISFAYYYQVAFFQYLPDGSSPSEMEVYISTDYTGGNIQDVNGNWLNGTWTKVNDVMQCRRSEGTRQEGSNIVSTGAPWGPEFIGTPYPGDQTGSDPENRKRPALGTFVNKWVECVYEIPIDQISNTFTVAFKVASKFEGTILFNAPADSPYQRGRGGMYLFTDFHYKAQESN